MKNNSIKLYERNVLSGQIGLRYNKYIPWLKVKDVKSCAVKSRIYSHRFGRMFHLLSHGEVMAFYQYEWDDSITELREQFPLDPKITIQICDDLKVLHPGYTHGGSVMTTDFVITKKGKRIGEEIYSAVQIKNNLSAINKPRTYTKLEIEHIYWQRKGIPWKIVLSESFNKVFCRNLEFLYPIRNTHFNQEFLCELRNNLRVYLKYEEYRPQDFYNQSISIQSQPIGITEGINILCAKKIWQFNIRDIPYHQCRMSDFKEALYANE